MHPITTWIAEKQTLKAGKGHFWWVEKENWNWQLHTILRPHGPENHLQLEHFSIFPLSKVFNLIVLKVQLKDKNSFFLWVNIIFSCLRVFFYSGNYHIQFCWFFNIFSYICIMISIRTESNPFLKLFISCLMGKWVNKCRHGKNSW